MDVKIDIGNKAAFLHGHMTKLRDDTRIIPENRDSLFKFESYITSIGIKESRRYKYVGMLEWLSKTLNKPFGEATKEDLIRIISAVENSDYAEWTKLDRKVTIKRFYKWLKGNDEEYPPEVRWIKCYMKNRLIKLPEDLITEEEVRRMADAAKNPRDKAFVQVLYESGCRIAEVLTIQMKNVAFDEYGAALRVTGKTGDRRVRIVASVPALAQWLDYHPYKNDPEAYVWLRNMYRGAKDTLPFRHIQSLQILVKLAEDAGVHKRVNPHAFRHARATVLANKLTEAQMKEYFGWVQGSDMAGVYVHLSGRDVDNAILGVYGMKTDEKKEVDLFRPQPCPRCGFTGSPGSKLCVRCGYAFSVDVAMQKEAEDTRQASIMSQLMKDPEFKELMLKKIAEMQIHD